MSHPARQTAAMKKNLTEIAFILDRSGSMSSVAQAAIAGFNSFLHDQQAAPGQARLTVVLFDDEYLVPIQSLPVDEVIPLDHTTYVPRNSTALLSAIGRTIDELGARLANLPETARPGKVIVAILTDGLENASQRETWRSVPPPASATRRKSMRGNSSSSAPTRTPSPPPPSFTSPRKNVPPPTPPTASASAPPAAASPSKPKPSAPAPPARPPPRTTSPPPPPCSKSSKKKTANTADRKAAGSFHCQSTQKMNN